MLDPSTEQVIFAETFTDNAHGWSNVGASSGQATIGSDPGGSGQSVWYPSVNSDGASVQSQLDLNGLDLADAPLALYMRVRVDDIDNGEANRFQIKLVETNSNRFCELTIRPQHSPMVVWRNGSGQLQYTAVGPGYTYPDTTSFVDFRLLMTDNGDGTMQLDAFRYDAAQQAYVLMGTVSNADLDTGVFGTLSIYARNSSGDINNRVYFDAVMATRVPRRLVNVRDYGALGDNLADDTFAIQSAIADLDPDGGEVLFFPRGSYRISSSLTVPSDTMVLGMGMRASRLVSDGSTITTPLFSFTGHVEKLHFKNLSISGGNGRSFSHDQGTLSNSYFDNVGFQSLGDGVVDAFYSTDLRDTTFMHCSFNAGPHNPPGGSELPPAGPYGSGFKVVGKMDHVVVMRSFLNGAPACYLDVPGGWGRSLFLANSTSINVGGMISVINGQDITFRQWSSEGLNTRVPEPAVYLAPGASRIAMQLVATHYSNWHGQFAQRPTYSFKIEGSDILMERCGANLIPGAGEPTSVWTASPTLWIRQGLFSANLINDATALPTQQVIHQTVWDKGHPTRTQQDVMLTVQRGSTVEDWIANPSWASGQNLDAFTPYELTIAAEPVCLLNKAAMSASHGGINVKDYGAIGDGVADDTLAIRAAVADLMPNETSHYEQGGLLYFPQGTYRVAEAIDLTLAADTQGEAYWIIGDGAGRTFLQGGGADGILKLGWPEANLVPNSGILRSGYLIEDLTLRDGQIGFGVDTGVGAWWIMLQRVNFTNLSQAGVLPRYWDNGNALVDCNFADSATGTGFYFDSPDDFLSDGVTEISHLIDKSLILRCQFTNLKEGVHTEHIVGRPNTVTIHHTYRDCTFTNIAGSALNIFESHGVIDQCTVLDSGITDQVPAVLASHNSGSPFFNLLTVANTITGAPYLLDNGTKNGGFYSFVRGATLQGPTTTGYSLKNASQYAMYLDVQADHDIEDWTNTWYINPWIAWIRTTYNLDPGPSPTDRQFLQRRRGTTDINFLNYGYLP